MSDSQSRIVNLHIAGAVTLPHPYPERGTISFERSDEGYWTARLVYRASPVQTIRYIVLIQHLAAIAWASDDCPIDPAKGEWWLGRDIERRVNEDPHRSGRGIFYLAEHKAVIAQVELATTAGDAAEYASRPCCPDR